MSAAKDARRRRILHRAFQQNRGIRWMPSRSDIQGGS
ncbi:TilS substrate-binding domain-containing protein [Streptomyces sp. NPDC001127]